MSRKKKSKVISFVAVVTSASFLGGLVLAHETRIVGKYKFVIGFRNEPAFFNEPNAADIILSRAVDGRPINRDAGDVADLQIEVQLRDAPTFASKIEKTALLKFPLTQAFGTPNRYNSWFKPTKPGTYAFHITGRVSDITAPNDANKAGLQSVDQTFVCESPLPPATHGFECVEVPQGFPNDEEGGREK